jgi:hypothetical protein
MLNDRVDPPIEINWVATKSLDKFSRNRYFDPADGEEYDETDLTPLERGHVYRYRMDADCVKVSCPYRVVDMETGRLLSGLRSFRILQPAISQNPRLIDKPRACLQDFSLSSDDFQLFSQAAAAAGWVVEKDEVDVGLLLSDLASMEQQILGTIEEVGRLRDRYCSGVGAATQEELDTFLTGVALARQTISQVPAERLRMAKQLDRLSREVDRYPDFVRCVGEVERVGQLVQQFEQLNLTRYEREAVHLFRVNTGQEQLGGQNHLRPLAQELQDLARYHPSLRNLSADGMDLLFRLSGLEIRVTPTSLQVTGDPGVLRPFIGSVPLQEGETDVSDRFRFIVSRQKPMGG